MRRGITLMEVLFAVGVITVGLFGVVALFPVALNQIGQGNVADLSFRLGQDAVTDFKTRGMARPDRWRTPDGNFMGNGNSVTVSTGTSYALDPRFVARHQGASSGEFNTFNFPYYGTTGAYFPGTPRMTRITLNGYNATDLMLAAEADGTFVLNDELVFNLPKDRLLPPDQQFGPAGASRIRRQSEGTLSWMATLTPIIDTSTAVKDRYLLSVVVFNRRDPTFSLYDDFDADNQFDVGENSNERIVAVNNFYGSGLGGADVELQSIATSRAAAELDLELRSGDWLILMTSLSPTTPVFRWYRVLEAEEEVHDSDPDPAIDAAPFARDVTLAGGDWPAGLTSYATLVSNVAFVYETTIRLETSGIWTD